MFSLKADTFVPRRFRQVSPKTEETIEDSFPHFDGNPVVVVIGEPGIGKTTGFKLEAGQAADSQYVKVADFLFRKPERYRGSVLFLDGLDEARTDGGNALAQVVGRLEEAAPRKVRISCRAPDWRGKADTDRLEALYGAPPIILELLPLAVPEIEEIFGPGGRQFIAEAEDRNLLPLLQNPQTLELLAKAVGQAGNWPRTRKELFDTALDILLSEENEEHQREADAAIPRDRLAEAADHMAAMILLANLDGWALNPANRAERCPPIQDFKGDTEALKVAGGRRLFTSLGPERVTLKHRMIGEYLAARHLARLVKRGLSLDRVLALITGFDGGTLTDLRGVFAWLAVFLPQEQAELLVQRDPAGAAAYGDIASWPLSLRKAALDILENDTRSREIWFSEVGRAQHGGFARPELGDRLGKFLKSGNEDLIYLAVWALSAGMPLPDLGDHLLPHICTNTFLATEAAKAFAHACPARLGELRLVLEDIAAGAIEDTPYYLRRELLRLLYPGHIPPRDVVRLMVPSDKESWFQAGLDIIERTAGEGLLELADAMVEFASTSDLGGRDWVHVGDALCERLLPVFGDLEPDQGYDVLCLGSKVAEAHETPATVVKEFLTAHPSTVLDLLQTWRKRHPPGDGAEELRAWSEFRYAARRCPLPTGAIPDLIGIAKGAQANDVAYYCADEAARLITDAAQPEMDFIFAAAETDSRIAEAVERTFVCWVPRPPEPDPVALAKWNALRTANQEKVRRCRRDLAAGTAIELLDHAIAVASGNAIIADIPMLLAAGAINTPEDRLDAHFGEAAGLIWKGMRAYVAKANLPSPEELALTHLAGGDEPRVRRLDAAVQLMDDQHDISTLPACCVAALAAQFAGKGTRLGPEWMERLLEVRTGEVAAAIKSYLTTLIRHGQWPHLFLRLERKSIFTPHPFVDLLREECFSYLEQARRCHGDVLRALLHVALARDPERTATMAAEALADRKLPSDHRGYWATAAFLTDVSHAERWAGLMETDFQARRAAFWFIGIALSETGTGLGLETVHLTRFFEVFAPQGAVNDDDAKHQASVAKQLIDRLAKDPSPEATDELMRTLADPRFEAWQNWLALAVEAQARIRREAARKSPTLAEIVAALASGPPANAHDRLAVVAEAIQSIGKELLHGGSDGWKSFWNEDSGKPKGEDSCRDVLLRELRHRLEPLAMTVEREGDFARHKRADLVVHQGTAKTPIEIKRHWNRTLWTAAKDQLLERYMSDPACEALGIYLVLWFEGPGFGKPRTPPGGERPTSPNELERELALRHPHPGIRFIVMDCGCWRA